MQLEGTICVVTGGASGIGRALAFEFSRRGAAGVVIADIDGELCAKVAERIEPVVPTLAVTCDVGDPLAVQDLVDRSMKHFGRIDIFCSNAGYSDPVTWDLSSPIEVFENVTRVNLMAHVSAAQAVLPSMVERGSGYLLQTLSSAALISGPAAAGYTLTKFGALGFAEWIAINYRQHGVRVSCICPNAVYTAMFGRSKDLDTPVVLPVLDEIGEMLLPEDVAAMAADVMEGEETFLILPHDRVGKSFQRKANNYDQWIERTASRITSLRPNDSGLR
jgi:NAD(P)-dependent dehydrogenase (short-subunit alcohol dehydrogenase family)